jgi:transcriptional antiterminator RfaH
MKSWYLLQSKPKQEGVAYQNLCNQAYETFLPTIIVEKIHRGVRKTKIEPLFNRYLFVRLDPDGNQSWTPLRSTMGVSQLVRFGSRYAKLADELVNALKDRIHNQPVLDLFVPGDRITITQGSFSGLEAVFKCYDGNHRALVLLNWLGNNIRVKEARFELSGLKRMA